MKPKVLTIFDCPFYHYKKYIDVKIDRKIRKASLKCKICKIWHETTENHLIEPIIIRLNVKEKNEKRKRRLRRKRFLWFWWIKHWIKYVWIFLF